MEHTLKSTLNKSMKYEWLKVLLRFEKNDHMGALLPQLLPSLVSMLFGMSHSSKFSEYLSDKNSVIEFCNLMCLQQARFICSL